MTRGDTRFKSVKSGLKWLSLASIVGRIFTFGMGIVLARYYLTPAQFGIVNMAAIGIMAIDLVRDFGLVEALLKREPLDDKSIHTAMWLLTGFAAIACALMMVMAPWIATAFREPSLALYLRVMCLSLLLSGLSATPLALLQRQDRWKEYATSDFIITIVNSGSTLLFAVLGAGAWSLIYGMLAKGIIQIIYTWTVVKWKPRWIFDIKAAKEMLGFGKWVTAVRFPDFFMYVADNAYLGRYAGKQNLGYYSQPYNWISQPLNLFVLQVGKALYPNLAKSQSDIERRDLFLRSYRILCWLVIPVYVYVGIHAQLIVDVVFGSKWTQSGPIFAWLCVAAMVRALTADGVQGYFWACGRGKYYAWPQWVAIVFLIVCMVWSRGRWDGRQIAILFTAGISLRGIINIWLLSTKPVKLSRSALGVILQTLWPCVLLAWGCHYLSTHHITSMTLQLITSSLIYGAGILAMYIHSSNRMKLSATRQDNLN
ncbi:MAG: lipopolysaccharide biosynthesis protein [Armatimonadota bacterium]